MHTTRDHYLPPDHEAFLAARPASGRILVIAPTRAACETIELGIGLDIDTVVRREHGDQLLALAASGAGFGIVAGTGTGKTLAIRPIAQVILGGPLKIGVVNREREATPETPTWNVVIVTTGIARRWFQAGLITRGDTIVADEIHQTSAELELCLALGKRAGCRFIWLSATVDPAFYARYLESREVIKSSAFDPARAARVRIAAPPVRSFLDPKFLRRVVKERRGVAVFVPTRAEVEQLAQELGARWPALTTAFYHGGEPIRVIRPFLEGTAPKPYLLAMTAAGQSALNIRGLDTVVILDARYQNVIQRGRNVLTRLPLGANEILQMAGRVHGRVEGGEVAILSERAISFEHLEPQPPEFQLAGDAERVALTCAALGVDARDLELPVALDRRAYEDAVRLLEGRGIIESYRLTPYGRDVEALPVDRPWAELLWHADRDLVPAIAVAASVDSLHRMTREERNLRGLIMPGSDHLSVYNVYVDAVRKHGQVREVHGMPRHVFSEALDGWAEERGVLTKAIEDAALGFASVYRALEWEVPAALTFADAALLRRFQDLVARVQPFDLVIDEETARGEAVRVSRGSVCGAFGAIAGSLRYFADRQGVTRAAIEGTNLPYDLVRHHARAGAPEVAYDSRHKRAPLVAVRRLRYFGFELDKEVDVLDPVPDELRPAMREALVGALMTGTARHKDARAIRMAQERLGEWWRRSGGTLEAASGGAVRAALVERLSGVDDLEAFQRADLVLDPATFVSAEERRRLDALPSHVEVHGERCPLDYEIDAGRAVVRIRLKEALARRVRAEDVPALDYPVAFTVVRGKQSSLRAATVEELRRVLKAARGPDSRRSVRARTHRRRS